MGARLSRRSGATSDEDESERTPLKAAPLLPIVNRKAAAAGSAAPQGSLRPDAPPVARPLVDEARSFPLDIAWSYLSPLVRVGATRPLQPSDVPPLVPSDRSGPLADRLTEVARLDAGGDERALAARITRALVWMEAPALLASAICKLLGDMLGFVAPLALTGIVNFVAAHANGGRDEEWRGMELGYWWLIAAVVASFAQNALLQHHHQIVIRAGLRAKGALATVVFRKALTIAAAPTSGGTLASLQSVDANAISLVFWFVHYTWAAPLQIAIGTALLVGELGLPALVGLAVLALLLPLQAGVGRYVASLTAAAMARVDERVRLVTEAVVGMRWVKLSGQEASLLRRIAAARDAELASKRRVAIANGANAAVVAVGPLLVALLTFVVYAVTSPDPLTPARAFASLALLSTMRLGLMILPVLVGTAAGARVSLRRVAAFLAAPRVVEYRDFEAGGDAATLRGATLAWYSADAGARPALRAATLSLPAGALTMVVGEVGAGKSTLLAALAGELKLLDGRVALRADAAGGGGAPAIAYCAQTPWVRSASLRANVVSLAPWDAARYAAVVHACALTADFATYDAGDATPVGDRGVSLSGGQRARLALARALYSPAPLLLLDDVLSAVDAHVGAHLWTHALHGPLVEGRTVVLASHALQFAGRAAFLVVLADGRVEAAGPAPALVAAASAGRGNAALAALMAERGKLDTALAGAEDAAAAAATAAAAVAAGSAEVGGATPSAARAPVSADAESDGVVDGADDDGDEDGDAADDSSDDDRAPLAAAGGTADTRPGRRHTRATRARAPPPPPPSASEERFTGAVSLRVYAQYLAAFGVPTLLSVAVSLLLSGAASIGADVWLAAWSDEGAATDPRLPLSVWMGVYAGITLFAAAAAVWQSASWAVGGVRASRALHTRMVTGLLGARMAFFDTSEVGQILNRCTSDVDVVDGPLPASFSTFVNTVVGRLAGTLILEAVALPMSLPGVAVAGVAFVLLQRAYRSSARELKRIEALSKSPVLAHASETLSGLSAIRAMRAGAAFAAENEALLDTSSAATLTLNLLNRWIGIRLDSTGSLFVLVVCLAAVLTAGTIGGADPSVVGLAIAYSLQLTGYLNWAVRYAAETETYSASVERVLFYAALPSEAKGGALAPPGWPTAGAVRITGLAVRYRPGLPRVLRGVNMDIAPGQRVAVVGRTGAGKSSLAVALLRLVEAEAGRVVIDGVDVSGLALSELRARVAIIPQESCLFSTTMRLNLDPALSHGDEEVWAALRRVGVARAVEAAGGLDAPLKNGGADAYSAGQRQLLCVVRALLGRPRVLICDEATSATDVLADDAVQALLASELPNATTITIAHRLESVLKADRVIVLDHGAVAEEGAPLALLQDGASRFAALVRDARGASRAGAGAGAGARPGEGATAAAAASSRA